MQTLPEDSKLLKVNALVAVLVSSVDESLGLGVGHLSPNLGDQSLELLGGDHAIAVLVKKLKCFSELSLASASHDDDDVEEIFEELTDAIEATFETEDREDIAEEERISSPDKADPDCPDTPAQVTK